MVHVIEELFQHLGHCELAADAGRPATRASYDRAMAGMRLTCDGKRSDVGGLAPEGISA